MKKTIIHLHPYKFINHDYQIREYSELEKKFKINVIIHDLSKIFYPNLNYVKAKNYKKSIKFKSLTSWIKVLKSLKNKNVVFVNELNYDSFKSLIVHYFLLKSKFQICLDMNSGVIDESAFFKNNFNLRNIKIKFLRVLKNPYLLIFFLKKKILKFLFLLIKFDKISVFLTANENEKVNIKIKKKKIIRVHSRDYSNYLNYKKKDTLRKKKPIIFLDAPLPYFMDDETILYGQERVKDIPRWYREHNIFFDKLEKFFSTKVIIVPHPKTKGVINPFFKKRYVDHRFDAALKLTKNSLFVISGIFVSTAISFAIASLKPIFFIYSDQMKINFKKQIIFSKETAKLIGSKQVDLNNFKKEDIIDYMKVDQELYDSYKNKYLTSKKLEKKPNHIIIGKAIFQ